MSGKRKTERKPFKTWKPSDEEELRKAVRNFNDKIRRLEKNPKYKKDKAALPEKITVTQLKEAINSRTDLKREIKSLKRFSERGAEKVVTAPGTDYKLKITLWQKKDMQHRLSAINRKRNARRKMIADIEMTQKGKKSGYTRGQLGMGTAEAIELKPMKAFSRKMNYDDLRYKYANMREESSNKFWDNRDMIHKVNYIKSLDTNFNENDIKDVIKAIENMDYRKFRKIFEAEGGNFELSYPENSSKDDPVKSQQYYDYLSELKSIWL